MSVCWVDVAVVVVISCVAGGKGFYFKDCISRSCCSAIINNLSTTGIVCGLDVRHNGVSCMSGIAWLTCDIVDIVSNKWLPDFAKDEIDWF